MSKPLENYIIRIKSSIDQFDNEGVIREEDRDHIELMTRGSFTKKNGSYYISYLGVTGDGIDCKLTEKGGSAAFSYLLDADDARIVSRNTLEMTVQHVN